MQAEAIIAALGLEPHPEGGWYRQTWVADGPGRPSGTCIYFLLKAGERSHWHRVDAVEIWHFHAGAPLVLRMAADAAGPAREVLLGPGLDRGEQPQGIVPEGWWQAAESTGDWTLVGCTVSPGFQFEGFELASPGFDIPSAAPDADQVLRQHFPGQQARYFAPLRIGNTPDSADFGAEVIMSGVKTATSTLPAEFGDGPLPFVGALSVVLDGAGRARGIAETTRVERVRFDAVTPEMARAYGEGDGTLDGWRQDFGDYYAREALRFGLEFGPTTELIFEWFEVVVQLDPMESDPAKAS